MTFFCLTIYARKYVVSTLGVRFFVCVLVLRMKYIPLAAAAVAWS